MSAWLVLTASLIGGGSALAEPVLHVFGPPGTSAERRFLAVMQGDDGRCLPWAGVTLAAEEEQVHVEPGATVGDCVRWVRVSCDPPRQTITLRADGAGQAAVTTVAMGEESPLRLETSRRQGRLFVRVLGVNPREPVAVEAYWPGGQGALRQVRPGRFGGTVPTEALVGVVARAGTRRGAALSVATVSHEQRPRAVIVPSQLSIEAGGAPRRAAYLIVTNDRGQPSRNLPLRIASERGRLRAMRWLRPGLAAIELSTELGVSSVDLQIYLDSELLAQAELAVSAGWPVAGQLVVPHHASVGDAFDVAFEATNLSQEPVRANELRLRCGPAEIPLEADGRASCQGREAGPLFVVGGAMVDGQFLPLVSGATLIRPQPGEPRPNGAPPDGTEPSTSRPPLFVGLSVDGELDTWAHGGVGLGGHLAGRFWRWLGLEGGLRYGANFFAARAAGGQAINVEGDLEGVHHHLELRVALTGAFLHRGAWSLSGRVGGGGALLITKATVGGNEASAYAFRPMVFLSLGPCLTLERTRLGLQAGLRVPFMTSSGTWEEAPVRFFVEVQVALAINR